MTDLPRRAVSRSARLASLPLGVAGRAAMGFGRRVGGAPSAEVAAELQARTAEQIFTVLGELKGGAMKFGQQLSIFEAAMPEQFAEPYRATLTKLQDSAPSLPASTVHRVLATSLGEDWRGQCDSFDDTPAAAASIGQVHRAVWADGRPVAVKVQYPGAGPALISDLNQVSRVARVAAGWVPGLDLKPILEELKSRMAEELDYGMEAMAQEQFASAFDGDARMAIPQVVASAEHVLVSEWVDGIPLSAIIASGTDAERREVAALYLEFLLIGPDRAGLLHADPHPGNYRLTPDGRLGVVDFGAVNRLPDGLPVEMGRLLQVALEQDAETLLEGLRDEGFVKGSIDLDAEELLAFLEPFVAPLRTEEFTFTRSWMRGVFAHINDPRGTQFTMSMKLNLPPQYLLIHRVWLGGIGVLCQIGAPVPARAILERCLPGLQPPPLQGEN